MKYKNLKNFVHKKPRGFLMKTIVLMLSFLLVAGFVFAQAGANNETGKAVKAVKAELYGEGNMTINKTGPVMFQNGTQIHAGLFNALENVKNERAREVIQRNMERFLERYQARLQNATIEVEIDEDTNKTTIKAKHEVKYLGFIKGKATDKYEIENNGKINEKKPWYRFMYTEQK